MMRRKNKKDDRGVQGMETKETLEQDNRKEAGSFIGFVLLSEPKFDKEKVKQTLLEDWNICVNEDMSGEDEEMLDIEVEGAEEEFNSKDILVFNVDGYMVAVGHMPGSIPDGEAECAAKNNYMWREAEEKTKEHQAHILVSVLGKDGNNIEKGELLVKVISACCKQDGVIGVYANGTVYQPELYLDAASILRDGEFPVLNLIWFGLYQTEKGTAGYTEGLRNFGKDEIEVEAENVMPFEIRDFLLNIVSYVILEDVDLKDGETIGFSEEQKLQITRSEGWAVDGMSLKIEYGEEE